MIKKYLLIFTLFLNGIGFSQEKLKEAKAQLSQESSLGSSSSAVSSSSSDQVTIDSRRNYSFWDSPLVGMLLFDIVIRVPYSLLIESGYEYNGRMSRAELSPYPYYESHIGDYTYDKSQLDKFSLLRGELSNELFLGNHIYQNHFQAGLRFASRCGASFSYQHFWENKKGYPTEHLDYLSLTAEYYRVRTQRVTLGWGIGAGYIGNEVHQFGLVLNNKGEVFVRSPFSLSYALQYTSFAHQNYFSFSTGVNYYYKRYKGGVKYKYNNLASSEFSGVNLSLGVTF